MRYENKIRPKILLAKYLFKIKSVLENFISEMFVQRKLPAIRYIINIYLPCIYVCMYVCMYVYIVFKHLQDGR